MDNVVAWRVGEFWSSAYPDKKVLCLAQGDDLVEWAKRSDFIRWVEPATLSELTDAQIVSALHSVGIDTYSSKNGFNVEQIGAMSITTLRQAIVAINAVTTLQPQRGSTPLVTKPVLDHRGRLIGRQLVDPIPPYDGKTDFSRSTVGEPVYVIPRGAK